MAVPDPDPGYTASGVPTFEAVQEKIETRYGTALGARELDAETPEGRTAEEQYEARQRAAAEKLRGDPRLDAPAGQRLTQALTLRRRRVAFGGAEAPSTSPRNLPV